MVYTALSGNPVISVMVSWMHNNAKDVKTAIDNTLRVSLAFLVKLENNNAKDEKDAGGAKNKSHRVYSTRIFDCVLITITTFQQITPRNVFHPTSIRDFQEQGGAGMVRYAMLRRTRVGNDLRNFLPKAYVRGNI